MSDKTNDSVARMDAALAALARHGFAGCRAREAADGVLVLSGSAAHEERLGGSPAVDSGLFAELHAAGFRYIALDLSPAAETAP